MGNPTGGSEELWGVKSLGFLGLEAHKLILVLFGICGALGPKFQWKKTCHKNFGHGPRCDVFRPLALSEVALGAFMASYV